MVPNMRWRNAAARRVRKDSPAVPAGCGAPCGAPSPIVEGSIFAPKSADTREPTVCLPAGAISAETRADLNNYERNENSQEGARKERVRGEGTLRRTR